MRIPCAGCSQCAPPQTCGMSPCRVRLPDHAVDVHLSQAAVLTKRWHRHRSQGRQWLPPAAAAAPTQAAAGIHTPDTQQYQGRAGRAQLWRDINVDEYPEG